ncbi:acyl-CoA thioesterase [Treponema endosymbiont of Eucomonympha sp.]|uniref:acyl-CoA thioesterase n=1 Tax=Treponema endosymbiont of Eucomonympha sp. TaxID=1580831 RepID=UPI0007519825|nr:acyl-CoA thioesterase [Treponema endosymbiont of Eucomonympha sp.]
MKHTAQVVVRTYECDSYRHVNNAVYLNYLEYARMEFLRACGFDYKGLVAAGYYLYITRVDIRYTASAVLDDQLFIDTEQVKLKRIWGTFHQTVYKADGTVCAEADVTWACVTADSKPSPIPDAFLVAGLTPGSP